MKHSGSDTKSKTSIVRFAFYTDQLGFKLDQRKGSAFAPATELGFNDPFRRLVPCPQRLDD